MALRTALVSDGMELILFLVAGIALCFGFRMRTALTIQERLSYC